jgi:cob(I)alamin adenosyltransferase
VAEVLATRVTAGGKPPWHFVEFASRIVGMKIYTKTGDQGMTGLFGGSRVSKSSPRIASYGDIDELNAVLGLTVAETTLEPIRKALSEVQTSLFTLGAQLASPKADAKGEVITPAHVYALERQIDVVSEGLEPLKNFILPGGSKTSAYLHLARTVCRRAERSIVHLAGQPGETVDRWVLVYVNRLSDFLFTMARLANQLENVEDIPWIPGRMSPYLTK